MKKIILIIFSLLLVILLNLEVLFSQSFLTDTIIKNNPITKDLIILPGGSNFIYMLPPEKSFSRDTNYVFLGFSSAKYPDVTLRIMLSESGYEDNENLLKTRYNILQQGVMRINNSFDLWYFKLSLLTDPETITWSIFFKNDFFYGNAKCSYNIKDDKVLGKGMEKTINSFVIIQRPDIFPTTNVLVTGNFDLIPIKFVKKYSWCASYFTEDGFPIDKTKGKKIITIMTAPKSNADRNDITVIALNETNKIFQMNKMNDSIVVEKIEPTTIMEFDGIKLSGAIASDNNLSFISYYAKITDNSLLVLLFGICESEEKDDFDKILDDFRKTIERNLDY